LALQERNSASIARKAERNFGDFGGQIGRQGLLEREDGVSFDASAFENRGGRGGGDRVPQHIRLLLLGDGILHRERDGMRDRLVGGDGDELGRSFDRCLDPG
jgi:hypothetical protein